MLDGNTGADSDLDAFGAVRMGRDFSFELRCFIYHRFQFFERVLCRAHRIAFRQHAARRAGLYQVGAVLDLITNCCANLVGPIGDSVFDRAIKKSRRVAVLVAVPAGDSKRMTGGLHSGPIIQPSVIALRRAKSSNGLSRHCECP